MFWRDTKGEQQMEFFVQNITSFLGKYTLVNDSRTNRKKLKKIEQKCESTINSITTYFNVVEKLEVEEIYAVLRAKKSDFWDKYFIHCILLATTEILIENKDFNKKKAISHSISIYSRELKELLKYDGGIELISSKLELIKSKIEYNLVFISKMFSEAEKIL